MVVRREMEKPSHVKARFKTVLRKLRGRVDMSVDVDNINDWNVDMVHLETSGDQKENENLMRTKLPPTNLSRTMIRFFEPFLPHDPSLSVCMYFLSNSGSRPRNAFIGSVLNKTKRDSFFSPSICV
jgi:hypothetical protein